MSIHLSDQSEVARTCFLRSAPFRPSPGPEGDFLLALSEAGRADALVTGDKTGLLALKRHKATRIISAGRMAQSG